MTESVPLTKAQQAGSAKVATAAMARLDEDAPWLAELSLRDKALLNEVLSRGVSSFCSWYLTNETSNNVSATFFGTAPGHLARSVTLKNTLQLIRVTIDMVAEHVDWLALPGEQRDVRESALRYSRDAAFAAAEVYAHAAEVRGAWDARLEALLVDALLRPDAQNTIASLVSALGWREHSQVLVLAASAPTTGVASRIAALRRTAATVDLDCLVGLTSGMLMVVVAGNSDVTKATEALTECFDAGPVVVSKVVDSMVAAGPLARSARSGLLVAAAWPGAPRPCHVGELLPERLLAGDANAREELLTGIFAPLSSDPAVLETVQSYLDLGRSLEGAARVLYVHPNTIRYRLRKAVELSGWDPTNQREGYVVQLALTVGRLQDTNL